MFHIYMLSLIQSNSFLSALLVGITNIHAHLATAPTQESVTVNFVKGKII